MKIEHDMRLFRANGSNSSLRRPYPVNVSVFAVFAGSLQDTCAASPPIVAVYVRLCTCPATKVYNYDFHSHLPQGKFSTLSSDMEITLHNLDRLSTSQSLLIR